MRAKRSFGERMYRRLLRLYPRDFRDEYAVEMARLYRDRARAERALGLWWELALDLIRTAPRERLTMLTHDLRHAFRLLLRSPLLTVSAIVTLALGIGANTAIFSIINAVLLSPLPYPDADRLVQIWMRFTGVGLTHDQNNASSPEVRDVTTLNRSLSHVAAYDVFGFNLSGNGNPERIDGTRVSPAVFPMLDVRPGLGRVFGADDAEPGHVDVQAGVTSEYVRRKRT